MPRGSREGGRRIRVLERHSGLITRKTASRVDDHETSRNNLPREQGRRSIEPDEIHGSPDGPSQLALTIELGLKRPVLQGHDGDLDDAAGA